MKKKTIEQVQEKIEADKKLQDDFIAYEDMDNVKFDFGNLLEDWMVPRIATDGMEALKTLSNIFDTYNPRVNIVPMGEADKERAERSERWAEYHIAKINSRAGKSPFSKMSHMAGKYGRIAAQVDYLPYWLPKDRSQWTSRQKDQMRAGPFCVELHARDVYYAMDGYGLLWVASVSNLCAAEVLDKWASYEDDKIKSALARVKAIYEENEDVRFVCVDYTSYDKREVSLFQTTQEDMKVFEDYEDGDKIDVIDRDNKLGFMNWVVVEGDCEPLLAGIHKSGLYKYKTLLDTVVHSSVMRRAYPPVMISKTMDKKGVQVDYTGVEGELKLGMNESVEPFIPPPLDQAVFTLSQQVSGQVDQATGIKKLAGMDTAANLQYSTVNAIIDLHMTNLEPYRRLAEKAATQIVYTMFKWVSFSGDTVEAFRLKAKPEQPTGEQIFMSPDDFDEERLLVNLTFIAKTDKMQAANRAAIIKQNEFMVPDGELLEELGYQNPEVLADRYIADQVKKAALQVFITEKQGEAQLKIEAAKLQMQNPAAQGAMGQMANPEQGMPSNVQGQGFNPSMGGTPPMMAEPGMTATQIPGERQ